MWIRLLIIIGKATIASIAIALYIGFCVFSILGFQELRQRWTERNRKG